MDADLQKVNEAVTELRDEVKAGRPDSEKMDRINDFLSDYEEKVSQPIIRAQEEAKNLQEDFKELEQKFEEAGVTHAEAKERVDALELELATRHAHQSSDNPTAYRESPEFKALQTFVRAGEVKHLQAQEGRIELTSEEKALLRTDVNGDGGYLVPVEMDSVIVKKITEIDPIRSIARVRTTASKAINLPIRATIPVAQYEAEAEEGTDDAATYSLEMVTPFRQTFTTPITLDMLQDSAFDMESEILADAGEAFAFGEGAGFVTGTGVKEPFGFTQNATLQAAARATGVSADFTVENLIDLTSDLKVGYDPVFVFNRRTLAQIRKFRGGVAAVGDAGGLFLWQPGLGGPVDQQLLGFRYILANSMPDTGADAFNVAFGDFRRGYTIVDRTGLAVIRDDVTQKRKATIEFTMHRWNTAQITLTEPIQLLQCDS